MTIHTREELNRLSCAARRDYSHAHMSDAKWRKAFRVLEDPELALCQMRIKIIEVNVPKLMRLPTIGIEHTPRPYIDTIEFGPIEFRAIEWLEIPAVGLIPQPNNRPPREVPQEIDLLQTRLEGLGKFPVERNSDDVRLVGYST